LTIHKTNMTSKKLWFHKANIATIWNNKSLFLWAYKTLNIISAVNYTICYTCFFWLKNQLFNLYAQLSVCIWRSSTYCPLFCQAHFHINQKFSSFCILQKLWVLIVTKHCDYTYFAVTIEQFLVSQMSINL
jgi:hypothetical protein